MGLPLPRSRVEWGAAVVLMVFLAGGIVWDIMRREGRTISPEERWHPVCAELCDDHEDARRQYEEMAERQKKRCDEKIAIWEKERQSLEERVEMCPCCPNGCDKELVYKDYLLQSQATYYRMILKKHCGVRRPPDPDEEELKSFAERIEEEEEEVF